MGSILYGPNGEPLKKYKRVSPPPLGEAFAPAWTSADLQTYRLPSGGVIQFNLDRLTLEDFRLMLDHYQVTASMSVLTFMLQQLEWRIDCENEKIRDHVEGNMKDIWPQLVKAMSQSFWAGYSPNILQWENDMTNKKIVLTKVKDLLPETSLINWKEVEGWAPPDSPKPKIKVYDGIKQIGGQYPIPVENSFWYPLLMQNGNWYGRKLLRAAFTPWFFSQIIHLFSNRYYERFGEPLAVGRAPYDDELDVGGKKVSGKDVMLGILQNLRSRGAVVLPGERSVIGNDVEYDYDIQYLESQMRGADFERYLTRLDEEISLALFTPLLMLRTADVGSYNLGNTHSHVYNQMLNALSSDMKYYIDRYILARMVDFNFSATSPRAKIIFRKLGDEKVEMVKALLQQLFSSGKVMPDLKEMGDIAGIKLTEVKEEPSEPDPQQGGGTTPPEDPDGGEDPGGQGQSQNTGATAQRMYERVASQFGKAFRDSTLGNGFVPDPGFRRQYEDAVVAEGASVEEARNAYTLITSFLTGLASLPSSSFSAWEELDSVLRKGMLGAEGQG